jgi:DNA-binding response OmpR family regulator
VKKTKAQIIIAEDNQDLRRLCKTVLLEEGYSVKTANDGYELISMLKKSRFDLLVLDLMLPSKTGLQIINAVKSICPGMFVVIYTGYDQYKTTVERLADAYILKSGSLDELKNTVNNLLMNGRQIPP